MCFILILFLKKHFSLGYLMKIEELSTSDIYDQRFQLNKFILILYKIFGQIVKLENIQQMNN